MGIFIYLYNVAFLCLFACAAFFCGVTREVMGDRRFGCLAAVMVLLALEGVLDMGEAMMQNAFSVSMLGGGYRLTFFSGAKVFLQAGEECFFYFLACDLLKRDCGVMPFVAFAVFAVVRCAAMSFGASVAFDMLYLMLDPVVVIAICVMTLIGLQRADPNEESLTYSRRVACLIIIVSAVAYACAIVEDATYAVIYASKGQAPFWVGKISFFEDALWAALTVACLIYARRCQEIYTRQQTEHLVRDRLELYRLEMERQSAARDASDIEDFCELYELTPREREVLSRVLAGQGNQEIADGLAISVGTVKSHVHSIYHKLSVSRRSELMGMFFERSRGGR